MFGRRNRPIARATGVPTVTDRTAIITLLVEGDAVDSLWAGDALSRAPDIARRHVERLSDALVYLAKHPVDAVVLDLELPDSQGLATLERLLQQVPDQAVVVLVASDDPGPAAVRAGAREYVVKSQMSILLLRAVRYAATCSRLEKAVRRNEHRLDLLAAHVPDYAIWETDRHGQITMWNPGAERMFGYADGEVIGVSAQVLYSSEDGDALRRDLKTAATEGTTETAGWRQRKDGSRFRVRSTIAPVYEAPGHIAGFVRITREADYAPPPR